MQTKAKKKSKPAFTPLNAGFKKRVKYRWRRPRGTDNKKRVRFASAGASPRIGYKNPASLRFSHPSGTFEVLVHNVSELKGAASANDGKAVRLASGIGKRKREAMRKLAGELKLIVLN